MDSYVPLLSLTLPILISAVLVFVASSIIHMFLPWHSGDYRAVPREDEVMAALRPYSIPPGDYMMPRPASMEAMKSAEFLEKRAKGPIMIFTVLPGGPVTMGRQLGSWFVYLVVVAVFGGYVAGRALPAGAEYLEVFRFVGVTAFAGLALGLWQLSIWYHRSLGTTVRSSLDALIYAMLMGGTFGWLWP